MSRGCKKKKKKGFIKSRKHEARFFFMSIKVAEMGLHKIQLYKTRRSSFCVCGISVVF